MSHALSPCQPDATIRLNGLVGDYVRAITDNWLLVAPKSNPAMLEMFRDRDAPPLRQMVPWAGEFAGKYLTGAVEVLRLTDDPRLRAWLAEFVDILMRFQAEDGYLGPWPTSCRLSNQDAEGRNTWDTWGHYHMMLGLTLWHETSGDERALACAIRITDLFCDTYLGIKRPRLVDTGSTEMNLAPVHALCILYRKTGSTRYLNLALQLVDEFAAKDDGQPLAGDWMRLALRDVPFYRTHKPRWESLHPIMALAELYAITGEDAYRRAFEQTWWSIVEFDRHNNGGFSSGEKATGDPYHLAPIESCCTIAWSALCVEMLKLCGNPVVADELELSLLNSVVGMHSPSGRWATYDTPMNGVRRASAHTIVFQAREGSPELNCCSVNTPRGFGLISAWGLMRTEDDLTLNYYGPSYWTVPLASGATVTLRQETDYPLDGAIRLTIDLKEPATFALRLRIPQWSARTNVSLNGMDLPDVTPGRYLTIHRAWQPGDCIDLTLDMSLRFWVGERACGGLVSVYRGPLLLAYDHRYNLDRVDGSAPVVRDVEGWDPTTCMLAIPPIAPGRLASRAASWSDWLPPKLLLDVTAADGSTIRLVDFGSAGAAGTPYRSWLPLANQRSAAPFSRQSPLRTMRPDTPATTSITSGDAS